MNARSSVALALLPTACAHDDGGDSDGTMAQSQHASGVGFSAPSPLNGNEAAGDLRQHVRPVAVSVARR